MTPKQLYELARAQGFAVQDAITVAAIALAESGGNPNAVSRPNSDPMHSLDRGLLQINSYWHSEVPDSCAYDPVCAMQAAFRISQGGKNFSPWSTFTSQKYRQYTSVVQQAINFTPTAAGGEGVPAPGGEQAGSTPTWTQGIVAEIEQVGGMIAAVILALALFAGGIVLLVGPQRITSTVTTVGKAALL